MKFSGCLKLISVFILAAIIGGCNCSTRCSSVGPMARQTGVALRDVHFAFDSSTLTPTAKQTLREDFENLGLAKANPAAKILLEGRADERGVSEYNDVLSQRRIASVKNYLMKLGASASQFQTRGLGERSPLEKGSNPDAWAKNRSVRVVAM